MQSNPSDFFNHQVWIAAGGAMLVLLRSILDGTRRTWYALLTGCILGAGGATLAGSLYHDSKWVYAICGVAAIMSENIVLGLFKASSEFREKPIEVFSNLWRLIIPFSGRSAGDPALDPEVVTTTVITRP